MTTANDLVGPVQPGADQPKTRTRTRRPPGPAWLPVMSSRGGPCIVPRTASQQGMLLVTAIDGGNKGVTVDQLIDACRPFTNKVTADYGAYLLSYFVPSWVQGGNGYGLQVRSTDRKLNADLKRLASGLTAGKTGFKDRTLTMSRAYKLAQSYGKLDTLRLRLTVPNGTKGHKGLPRDKDIDA